MVGSAGIIVGLSGCPEIIGLCGGAQESVDFVGCPGIRFTGVFGINNPFGMHNGLGNGLESRGSKRPLE